eukprot:CAMPEP_0203819898 /NCGR_PEP_ID=MMETSP0115-20131106/37819_1 /ASSEMBLY_ACC=CAM_ASM_000227 /TAXON_ID=33651 /ORGANISM="Bicosoecid sp, Strain ms1" /LENGTH=173 /DNA_ID=CAMNT_0050728891 /DNA_START=165 /DNA_END=683 /DNA_ORIENTATION=-
MCKHVLNAQVSVRFPCCFKFYDCADCHDEKQAVDHEIRRAPEMVFQCKKCEKTFRKNMLYFEEADEFCPHCGNHYLIPAQTPATEKALDDLAKAAAAAGGEDSDDAKEEEGSVSMVGVCVHMCARERAASSASIPTAEARGGPPDRSASLDDDGVCTTTRSLCLWQLLPWSWV